MGGTYEPPTKGRGNPRPLGRGGGQILGEVVVGRGLVQIEVGWYGKSLTL
jgi:hypothetical protein